MATTYPFQSAAQALARNPGRRGVLRLAVSAGLGVQLFYFAIGPFGRLADAPFPLRYPLAEQAGFAVGPHGEAAVTSAFYGHVQVYGDEGGLRGVLRLDLAHDEAGLAWDQEGNLYAATARGIEVFDAELRPRAIFPPDDRDRPGVWKLAAPGRVEFFPSACPTREALAAPRAACAVGGPMFLVSERAGRQVARPVGDSRRCVARDGSEAVWNGWLARVDFHARDGTSWSVGTPWALLPFTLVWPGVLWWGVAIGLGWRAFARRLAAREDPREARRRQLV